MDCKLEIVVQSNLSDALIETSIEGKEDTVRLRIEFVKYAINKSRGNLNQNVDADDWFEEFEKNRR